METPDCIYIFTDGDERWYDVKEWEGRTPPPANVEYIRKDAILEWAEKKKNDVKKFGQRYNEANYYNSGCHDTIQELIDKLNSQHLNN